MTRTEWFPVHIKPMRKGVYERSYGCGIRFAYWNGHVWGGFAQDIKQAYDNRKFASGHQDAAWRGLADATPQAYADSSSSERSSHTDGMAK